MVSIPRLAECGETGASGFTSTTNRRRTIAETEAEGASDLEAAPSHNVNSRIGRLRKLIKKRRVIRRDADDELEAGSELPGTGIYI